MRNLMMDIQHRVKSALKPLVFADVSRPRRVKAGPGRGVTVFFNRRHDLQREFGLYETEVAGIYRQNVHSGTIAVDVGGADGLSSLIFAQLGATVTAFEPDPDALSRFRQNVALNPQLADRITLVPKPYGPGEQDAADFVKVDVDGAEADVLRAMPNQPACVVVETHSAALESECEALLAARGYAVRIVRNARWRTLFPEYRPVGHNRWLLATLPDLERPAADQAPLAS
jgi:hypothetical protein